MLKIETFLLNFKNFLSKTLTFSNYSRFKTNFIYLNAKIVIRNTSPIQEDGKKRENRSFTKERHLGPDHHYSDKSANDRDEFERELANYTLIKPF